MRRFGLGARPSEASGTMIGIGIARHRRRVWRVSIRAALRRIPGIAKAAAVGVAAAGVAIARGRALAAIDGRAFGGAAVVSVSGVVRPAIVLPVMTLQRTVRMVEQQVAQEGVLAVKHPKIAAPAVIPIAVTVGSDIGRRDVREPGRLRHALGFEIVFAGRFVLDRHAEIVLAGCISRA